MTAQRLTYAGVAAFMMSFAIPMSFFYYVFPPMLRSFGHGPEIVGAFALVYLPYVLRGFWAFAIERLMQGHARRYRIATFVLAILGTVSVLGLLLIDPMQQIGAAMGMAVAIFAIFASGMTTLDGYLLATLSSEDRAASASWSAIGVALGGIAVGGMAWFDVFSGSWTLGVLLLAAATLAPALPILLLPPAPDARIRKGGTRERSGPGAGIRPFLAHGAIRAVIVMTLLAHGTTGMVSGYLPVLQVDAGLSIGEIGLFNAMGSNVMGLVGAVLGGWMLARFGGWRALAAITALLAVLLTGIAILHEALWGKSFAIGLTALLMMAGYIYYVPFRALILAACDGPGSVSRVAILSSVNMTVGILGMSLAGVVAVRLGLTSFFALGAMLMLASTFFALGQRSGAASLSEPDLTFTETSSK